MAKKKPAKEEEVFDDVDDDATDDDTLDDYEELEFKQVAHKPTSNARRRHEQLKEERALQRLLNEDYSDWD
jgi:hypothetical protein